MNTFITIWLLISLTGTLMFCCMAAVGMGTDERRPKIKGNIHQ